jgi:hypothetical protein
MWGRGRCPGKMQLPAPLVYPKRCRVRVISPAGRVPPGAVLSFGSRESAGLRQA